MVVVEEVEQIMMELEESPLMVAAAAAVEQEVGRVMIELLEVLEVTVMLAVEA